MRIATMAAAFSFALMAPAVISTSATAQFTEVLPAAEQATFDAAVAAVFADTTLTADQVRDQIATLVQNSSNPTAAARLVVATAASQSVAIQQAAGAALSQVSTNLQTTDPATAANIVTVVATSPGVEIQIGYATNVPTTTTPTTPTTPVVTRTVTGRLAAPTAPVIPAPATPPQGQVVVNAQQGNPFIPQIGGGSNSSPT